MVARLAPHPERVSLIVNRSEQRLHVYNVRCTIGDKRTSACDGALPDVARLPCSVHPHCAWVRQLGTADGPRARPPLGACYVHVLVPVSRCLCPPTGRVCLAARDGMAGRTPRVHQSGVAGWWLPGGHLLSAPGRLLLLLLPGSWWSRAQRPRVSGLCSGHRRSRQPNPSRRPGPSAAASTTLPLHLPILCLL